MKLSFQASCCFLLSVLLVTDIVASHRAQSSFEDVYARAKANLDDPAKQYIFTKNVFVLSGRTIALFPIDEGAPAPNAVWRKDGQLLEYGKRRADGRGREYVIIDHTSFADNGIYTYEAADGKSNDTYAIKLEVLSAPYFTQWTNDVEAVEGKTLELKCEVDGAPKPVIKWTKDDEEVTGEHYETMDNGSLRIRDAMTSDSGEYTCHATNEYGKVDARARLEVKRATKITEFPEKSEVLAGNTVTLRCIVVADRTLRLRIGWQRNGQSIDVHAEPRIIQRADESLMIIKTNKLDSGTYTCIASTDLDEDRAEASLVVHGESNPPTLLGVTCGADEASVAWTPANDSHWPILRYSIQYNTSFTPDFWETASHRIPAADQSSSVTLTPWANYTFRVIAWNEIGPSQPSSHSSVCTTLPDVPYKNPDNVVVKSDLKAESRDLVIKWTVMPQIEHHAPKLMYRVYYKRDVPGEKWTIEDVRDWRTNELTVENNETSFQEYKIKVIAVNERGESTEKPREVVGFLGDDLLLEAPRNVTLKEMTYSYGKAFLLSWNKVPDESVRGELRGYKIELWNVKENDLEEIGTVGPNETQTLFSGLSTNSLYHATIKAFNRRFEGPPTEKIIIET